MTRPTTAQLNAAYDQLNFWYDKAKKLDEELAKAEKRIAELEEAEQKLCAANVTLDARADLAERQLAAMDSETVADDGIYRPGDAVGVFNVGCETCPDHLVAWTVKGQNLPAGNYWLYISQQPAPVVPDGWVMVPKEPTSEMQSAGASAIRIETTAVNKLWTGNAVYWAMLAAAPQEVK